MLISFDQLKTFYGALAQKMKDFRGNWDQNDPSAEDYLKNRPFYSEKGTKILSEVSEISIQGSDNDEFFEALPIELYLEAGKKYIVIFNGTKYVCTAWSATEADAVILGNGDIYGGEGGNGEPFAIDNYSNGAAYLNVTSSGTYNLTIQLEEEIIHKLDKKFVDSSAIIDVIELPTENIDENSIYRALTGKCYWNGLPDTMTVVYVVKTLPTVGTPALMDTGKIALYYEADTNAVVGYIDEATSDMTGIPFGWCSAEVLIPAVGGPSWGGIIWKKEDDLLDNSLRLLLSYSLYQFKGEWIVIGESEQVGWKSPVGMFAEIFNYPSNIATGDLSHAEGGYSHAEGVCSHAEGESTHAEGGSSHAEGYGSHAVGYTSHAEGCGTHAAGRSQHAQGEYNAIDPEYNDRNHGERAKYVHIVGNGTSENERSNAHTLDWNGNAWYAGTVYVGGTSQTDGNEVATKADFGTMELITVADIDTICGTTIQVATASEVTF